MARLKVICLMTLMALVLYEPSVVVGSDMIVGDTVHRKMVFHQRVKDFAIPFKKRIKVLKFADPEGRTIRGIAVVDNDFSHASANITEGGIGYTHATVRMKSQRSYPLNYEVEFYV